MTDAELLEQIKTLGVRLRYPYGNKHEYTDSELIEIISLVQAQRQGECQCCIALKNLVELKTHKDKFGKDRDYRLMQPSAWEFARSTLPSPPTEDKHDIK